MLGHYQLLMKIEGMEAARLKLFSDHFKFLCVKIPDERSGKFILTRDVCDYMAKR